MNLNLNRYLRPDQIEKLSTLVNATFGRLSPLVLGSGYSIFRSSEAEISAKIPLTKFSKDFQNEAQSGLVIHTATEMIRVIMNEVFVDRAYRFSKLQISLDKKMNWNSDLILKMQTDLEALELKTIEFQKNKKFECEFKIHIYVAEFKKSDILDFKIEVQKVNILT
jgi:hypothetical protein